MFDLLTLSICRACTATQCVAIRACLSFGFRMLSLAKPVFMRTLLLAHTCSCSRFLVLLVLLGTNLHGMAVSKACLNAAASKTCPLLTTLHAPRELYCVLETAPSPVCSRCSSRVRHDESSSKS